MPDDNVIKKCKVGNREWECKGKGGLGTHRDEGRPGKGEKTQKRLTQLLHVFNSKNYFFPVDKSFKSLLYFPLPTYEFRVYLSDC